jgi:hypothetical protein
LVSKATVGSALGPKNDKGTRHKKKEKC